MEKSDRTIGGSLLEVFLLQKRIFLEEFGPVGEGGQEFKDPPDGNAHPADTGFAATLARINSDSIKMRSLRHDFTLGQEATARGETGSAW